MYQTNVGPMPPEPTEEWRRIIESISVSDQISENNQEFSHNISFSTNIQEDGITHTECLMDNENDANSNGLNTVTSGRKDKVSRKKKANIKLKEESSSSTDKVDNASKGSDTSRREFDLNKLVNITREAVMHLIYSP
ncbi:hypothetical protein GLOIN_2v1779910 [Rhizophagus clarus]|uniref:Uncharacterized protein n=1 Tax=Rhizophagus clarus TaxID=94130 RepID=A0A8H3LRH4_9GLOM|nr:hypothetical protein GLOIN_2v1779910 [Rhizophagus clarus]